MLGKPIPDVCPQCGSRNTARVEWGSTAALSAKFRAEMDGVAFILGGLRRPSNAPDWICLTCQPEWSNIHELALKEYACERKRDDFVAMKDFDSAAEWNDKKRSVQQEIATAIQPLLPD
jgi:hypothetical protein